MKEWGILPHQWLALPSWEKASLIAFEREHSNLESAIVEARREQDA